jgi:hypothetical protein
LVFVRTASDDVLEAGLSYVYSYITRGCFTEVHRRGTLDRGCNGVRFFSPDDGWAETYLSVVAGVYTPVSRREMVANGLYRVGALQSQLLPIGQLERVHGLDRRRIHRQLQALEKSGVDLHGWRALTGSFSILDFVNDRFRAGSWRRIIRLRRTSVGPVVLEDRVLASGRCSARPDIHFLPTMSKYLPALDATRVSPDISRDHRVPIQRLLAQMRMQDPVRRGITHAIALQEEYAARWLVEAFCQASGHRPSVPLALPRSRQAYTSTARHRVPFAYNVVTRLLDGCRALAWIEEITGNEARGITRLFPRGELQVYSRALGRQWSRRAPPSADSLLVLGEKIDQEKVRRFVVDGERAEVAAWRKSLDAINHFLAEQCIHLRASDEQLREIEVELAKPDKNGRPRLIDFGRVAMRRIFTQTLDMGGRYYGGWWQNAPSDARQYIWINEWQGIECDYSGMALRCVYAMEGLTPPDDPYDIGLPNYGGRADARRDIVKDFINASLNDRKNRHRVAPERLAAVGMSQADLIRRIEEVHAPIRHHLRSDVGLRMQFIDSRIAELVMLKLMALDIVCLPIHDSFIVPAPFVRELQAAMESSFQEVTGQKARLGWCVPAVSAHLGDEPLAPEEVRDKAALRSRIDREYERFSDANDYFVSWADRQWGELGWKAAMEKLDSFKRAGMPRSFFRFHAFPLPLLLGHS